MRFNKFIRNATACITVLMVVSPLAMADEYPSKPVHIVAPFTAGGGTDILARIVAQKLSESFKQTFLVENKAGANGGIGADFVAKSAPDGYTLLLGSNGPNAVNAVLYQSLAYDPQHDFAP